MEYRKEGALDLVVENERGIFLYKMVKRTVLISGCSEGSLGAALAIAFRTSYSSSSSWIC
jgi:hypothetical protein